MNRLLFLLALLAPTAALADPFSAVSTLMLYASGTTAAITAGWSATLFWGSMVVSAIGGDAARRRHRERAHGDPR